MNKRLTFGPRDSRHLLGPLSVVAVAVVAVVAAVVAVVVVERWSRSVTLDKHLTSIIIIIYIIFLHIGHM